MSTFQSVKQNKTSLRMTALKAPFSYSTTGNNIGDEGTSTNDVNFKLNLKRWMHLNLGGLYKEIGSPSAGRDKSLHLWNSILFYC